MISQSMSWGVEVLFMIWFSNFFPSKQQDSLRYPPSVLLPSFLSEFSNESVTDAQRSPQIGGDEVLLHTSLQFHTCTCMLPCTPTPHLFLHCPIKLDIIINSIFSIEFDLLESYLEVVDYSFSGRLGEYQEKMIQILVPPELDLQDAFRYNPPLPRVY